MGKNDNDLAVGAMAIITSISQFVTMPLQGICQGGQSIISYNYGARQTERVKKAFFTQFIVCITYTIFFWIVIMLIPLIFLLPNFFSNKVFAVFLAKPVSDILAAAVTTITFFTLFNKILKKEVR